MAGAAAAEWRVACRHDREESQPLCCTCRPSESLLLRFSVRSAIFGVKFVMNMATHQRYSSNASLLNIQAAFESLEKAIHPSDVTLFRSTTLHDVMKAAKVIESDQSRRRCLRNLRRIQPLFEALGQFSGALEILCQGTPYLCYIWVRNVTGSFNYFGSKMASTLSSLGTNQTSASGFYSYTSPTCSSRSF